MLTCNRNVIRAAHDSLIKVGGGSGTTYLNIREVRLPLKRPEYKGFDPRDYRSPTNLIKPWMAYFNLLRTMFGAGMLGMPSAVSQAGIILGPILSILTGALLIHTQTMLLQCLNEMSRQLRTPYISYRYGFRLALLHGPRMIHCIGERGPEIIATYIFLNQMGICTVFVSLTSDSVRDLMDWQSNRPALLTLLFPYLLLEFFMKTLKIVSYVSLFGNCMNVIGFILIVMICMSNISGDVVTLYTSPYGMMVGFGIYLFNMSAVAVIMALDKSLEEPRLMTSTFGVINVGIFIPCVVSTMFGIIGYYSFGSLDENILRSLPLNDGSALAAISMSFLAVAFAYPIQCYPGVDIVMEVIKNLKHREAPSPDTIHLIESIARPIFVVMSFILCYLLPFQTPLVAFVGNMSTSMLALTFPAMMDVCLRYPDYYGPLNLLLIKDLIIIALGITSELFGVYKCAYVIYVRVLAYYSPNTSGFY